ncbi:hypothetical protein [Paenibacillus sp. S150]|uniref:hypothetical protein n=1 Tax=Paenibacillus sp. S150 TaxID=2749826 RepID=UPI001C55966B|nr:hypothetical protein [Paenibacillus sp. S150]MBW4085048.1 hypothetical protein [Paenibacillus sp. S150]
MNLGARKSWGAGHKQLTGIITKPEEHTNAAALFLKLHACLYASPCPNPDQPTHEESC